MNDLAVEIIPLEKLAGVLSDPGRWLILQELGKGEPLPVQELAKRTGRSAGMTSKHMATLRDAGVVVVGFGRLYQLAPVVRPAPGAKILDLGLCQLRLDVPA